MNLGNVILDAGNQHEIYFLLTSYIEALRYCRQLESLPGPVARLPLDGLDDVRVRFSALAVLLADASHPLDDQARRVLREAACIFGAALHRLSALELEASGALTLARRGLTRDARVSPAGSA